ncbi:MAG: Peptidyl-tRNA hydrolase [Devosia sp.]|nr:Peptidyl-tRNA hydrolase [Devosia sp.]
MHLLAGLGNPGEKYAGNRHNVGFMAIDAIAAHHKFPPFRSKFNGLISEAEIAGEKVLLLKPQTFMNESGQSVAAAASFYKLRPEAVTVFYDELDLVPGKVRVKRGGGNGGHNGLRSIDPRLGLDYRRVRIGIGHPGHKDRVMPHVLGDFAKIDRDWLKPLLDTIAEATPLLLKNDDNGFMNRLARAVNGDLAHEPKRPRSEPKPQRQAAPPAAPPVKAPETGPMAAMLKKLFGGDKD